MTEKSPNKPTARPTSPVPEFPHAPPPTARPALLIVAATQLDEASFLREAPLARMLDLHGETAQLRVKVAFDNRKGLPTIYNQAIADVQPDEIVVFCHDDVALDDPWLPERLSEALAHFDIVGVAGCAIPLPDHSSWLSGYLEHDAHGQTRINGLGELAGRVRHGSGADAFWTVFGAAPRAVQLLDGCFLAVRGSSLLNSGLRFDELFDFHFYDLDFCRSATALKLKLGVWPLAITHASEGNFGSASWQVNLARYWGKWPPPVKKPAAPPTTAKLPEMTVAAVDAFNTANSALKAERWREALDGYTVALAAAPALLPAHLGRARCLVKLNEWMPAREAFAAVLRLEPSHYSAWLEVGHLCRQMGEFEQAIASYQRALAVDEQRYEAWLGLTRVLEQTGQWSDAASALTNAQRAAAQTSPAALRSLWQLLGKYRLERGDLPPALLALRCALALARRADDPAVRLDEAAEIRIDIAELLLRDNQPERAMQIFTEASASERESTLTRLAETAFRFNLWQEAIEVSRRNLALHPDSPWAYWNLAHLLAECWQMSEADSLLERAEALAAMPGAQVMRGHMTGRLGDADTALAHYREHHAAHPADFSIASSMAMCALYCDTLDAPGVAALTRELFAPLGVGARSKESFKRAPWKDATGQKRRIRLGLVSADFHFQHPVNIFMQPILRELDRTQFEVFLYFTGVSSDAQTHLAKSRVEHWIEATPLNDRQLAKQIDSDEIDILMDLSGHTGRNRMAMFAQRAAPVQVTYLGYPGSTGLPNMDWLVGDAIVTPASADALYSEAVARLPGTVFCFAPEVDYPYPVYTQAHAERPLTFGSFNNVPKLTPHTLRLWARILAELPASRLLLKAPSFADPAAQAIFRERLSALGVAPERVEFRGPVGLSEMMTEYADVDIALDPVPYNGGTTTLQAMWMGVPIVVKEGAHFVSRMGASFMRAVGLEDWVAADDETYVAIAVAKGQDRQALLALKQGLRERQLSSPAWDVKQHTRAMEAAFIQMIRPLDFISCDLRHHAPHSRKN